MKKVLHKADSRGVANHGWLQSRHTFSFAGYYNPERMHFGALRVLNDDIVTGGKGFGKHPHDNMEIVSIPLAGALEHKDSMGTKQVIKTGDVQIMSAGTGVAHSEYNHSATKPVNFLQIWVFPKEKNIKPRYEQKTFSAADRAGSVQTVVSPEKGQGVWINQDAWFSLADLKAGKAVEYKMHLPNQGVYVFVLEGSAEVAGEKLGKRDAIGISATDNFSLSTDGSAELLLMEVPMF